MLIFGTPSLNEVARDGMACERWNLLHPDQEPRLPWITQCLQGAEGR